MLQRARHLSSCRRTNPVEHDPENVRDSSRFSTRRAQVDRDGEGGPQQGVNVLGALVGVDLYIAPRVTVLPGTDRQTQDDAGEVEVVHCETAQHPPTVVQLTPRLELLVEVEHVSADGRGRVDASGDALRETVLARDGVGHGHVLSV